jgi:hypothetical protein
VCRTARTKVRITTFARQNAIVSEIAFNRSQNRLIVLEVAAQLRIKALVEKAEPINPPARRRFRLTDVRGCKRELASIYADARNQEGIDWQDAARAASILQILARLIEGGDFEARIVVLEAAAAERKNGPAKPNGHQPSARQ